MKFLMHVPADSSAYPAFVRSPYSGKTLFGQYEKAFADIGTAQRTQNLPQAIEPDEVLVVFGEHNEIPPALKSRTLLFAGAAPDIAFDETKTSEDRTSIETILEKWGSRLRQSDYVLSASEATEIAALLGTGYSVATISIPLPDEIVSKDRLSRWNTAGKWEIDFSQLVIDTATMALSSELLAPTMRAVSVSGRGPVYSSAAVTTAAPVQTARSTSAVPFGGVIFVADVESHTPSSGWWDLVTAFCDLFRNEPHATLVVRLGGDESRSATNLVELLCRFAPMQCRVAAFRGPLGAHAYAQLASAASFYVHSSGGPGGAMTLMEFAAQGVPPIVTAAPAMKELVGADYPFLVNVHLADCASRPGRPLPGSRYDVVWQSLRDRFAEAFALAGHQEDYTRLATSAAEFVRKRNSVSSVSMQILDFLRKSDLAGR